MYEKIVLKNALKSVQKYYFTFESLYFSTLIVKYLINNGIFIIQNEELFIVFNIYSISFSEGSYFCASDIMFKNI